MQDNSKPGQPVKTICGPYDAHFNKKFRGRTVKSLSIDRIKLSRMPKALVNKSNKSSSKSHNMLPKLRQLQKIAKTQRKRGPKLNKYLDGISDLDLYIANKQLNNLTTQQIVTQLAIRQRRGTENIQAVNMFYAQTGSKNVRFHQVNPQVNAANQVKGMSKTDYVRKGKWVSDQELIDKFDKFIVHGHLEQSAHNTPRPKTKLSRQQMTLKISKDKEQMTQIAKKMIAEHSCYSDEQELELVNKIFKYSILEGSSQHQSGSIEWILSQCDSYNKKFQIKRGLSRIG